MILSSAEQSDPLVSRANHLILETAAGGRVGFSLDHSNTGCVLVLDLGNGTLGLRERKQRQNFIRPFGDHETVEDYLNARAERMLRTRPPIIRFDQAATGLATGLNGHPRDKLVIACDPDGLNGLLAEQHDAAACLEKLQQFVRSVIYDMSAVWFLGDYNPLYMERLRRLGGMEIPAAEKEALRPTPQEAQEWTRLRALARERNWSVFDLMRTLAGEENTPPLFACTVRAPEIYQALVTDLPVLALHRTAARPVPAQNGLPAQSCTLTV